MIEISGRGAEPLAMASRCYVDMCRASSAVAAPTPVRTGPDWREQSGPVLSLLARRGEITAQDKGLAMLQ
jgi:hypothetical protein